MTNKIVVILYGPPGAGKGTQAELLERNLNFVHFDSGSQLRALLYDPQNKGDKEIQRERKINEAGNLNTPAWVLKIVKQKTKKILALNQRIVFSGSPRTFLEAFGLSANLRGSKRGSTRRVEGLLKFFVKEFGKKNIFIFILKITEKGSIFRNSNRVCCSICGATLLAKHKNIKTCPFCAGKIIKRKDDNKKIITERLKEYRERTRPIFSEVKKQKYNVIEIDGTPPPYRIFKKIADYLKKNAK